MIFTKLQNIALLSIICWCCVTCSAQVTQPINPFTFIITDKETGDNMDLVEWLEHDVSYSESDSCTSTFGFFYFKVTSSGKIDSLAYNGTLAPIITDKIIDNIKKTQGNWKIPVGTSKSVSQWFVFPYFDFSKYNHLSSVCSEKDKLLQKNLRELSENLKTIFFRTNGKITIIGVSQNRGPYIKI